MNEVRIGIVGISNMGLQHARYIVRGEIEGARLTAVCATRQATIDSAKKELPEDVAGFTDYDAFLHSGLIDAVMIVTPHYSHPELTIKAFEAGLHVLVEKPAGVYTKQVLPMNEAAEKSGKVYSIMYQERANPVFVKLREMIKNGKLGRIHRIIWIETTCYRNDYYYTSTPWRGTYATDGGGVLLNQAIHQLDTWQWLFGMPQSVQAFCEFGKYHPIEVEDEAVAHMRYPDGAIGTFIASTGDAPGTNRLEITCDNGKVIVEGRKLTFHKLEIPEPEYNKTSTEAFGHLKSVVTTVEYPPREGFLHPEVTQNFTDAILYGAENKWDGRSGLNSLELANAMVLSSWEGNSIIPLPMDAERYYSLLEEKIGKE